MKILLGPGWGAKGPDWRPSKLLREQTRNVVRAKENEQPCGQDWGINFQVYRRVRPSSASVNKSEGCLGLSSGRILASAVWNKEKKLSGERQEGSHEY